MSTASRQRFAQAVKSVLVMAGSLKRGYPDVDEDLTLIRALVDSNVPKFLADDLPLFAAIVKVGCAYLLVDSTGAPPFLCQDLTYTEYTERHRQRNAYGVVE